MWIKRLGCHAGHQMVNRCRTRGESEESIALNSSSSHPWQVSPTNIFMTISLKILIAQLCVHFLFNRNESWLYRNGVQRRYWENNRNSITYSLEGFYNAHFKLTLLISRWTSALKSKRSHWPRARKVSCCETNFNAGTPRLNYINSLAPRMHVTFITSGNKMRFEKDIAKKWQRHLLFLKFANLTWLRCVKYAYFSELMNLSNLMILIKSYQHILSDWMCGKYL